jgi:hypothetical protein
MLFIERRKFNYIVLGGVAAITVALVAYQIYVITTINRMLGFCMTGPFFVK